MNNFKLLIVSVLFICSYAISQVLPSIKVNQKFYLIDTLPINDMMPEEKILLDSLLNVYHSGKTDTIKYKTLLQIPELITDANIWPAYNHLLKNKLSQIINSNSNIISKQKLKKYLIRTINNEGLNEMYLGAYEQAMAFYNEALKMAIDEKEVSEEAELYNSIGGLYHVKGDLKQTLLYYTKSLNMFKKLNHHNSSALLLYNIAQVYYLETNFPEALKNAQESVLISERTKNLYEAGTCYSFIGSILAAMDEFGKANTYFQRALEYSHRSGSKMLELEVVMNIANLYSMQNKNPESKEEYEKARILALETNNQFTLRLILINLAKKYTLIKNYKAALTYANEANSLIKEDNKILKISSLNCLAEIHLHLQDYKLAKEYGAKAFSLSNNIANPKGIRDAAFILKEVFAHENNWKEAFNMQSIATKINDTINTNENKRALYNKIYQIEYEKKELELLQEQKIKDAIASEEREVAELKLSKNRYYLFGLITLFMLISAIAYLYHYQNKLKANQKEMQLEQKLLRTQMNPHFIFNSLNSIHSVVLSGDAKSAGKYLASFSKLIRSILESSRFELISLEKEINLLSNYISLQILRFENNIQYKINIDSSLDATSIMLPPMLTQPFIENAIEHGLSKVKNALLIINISVTNNILMIEVMDNGPGLGEAKNNNEHVSLAMNITKDRLNLLNQEKTNQISFSIQEAYPNNKEQKGVKVIFQINVS